MKASAAVESAHHPSLGLNVTGLRVEYDGFVAVADANFEVAPGESFGIVGESGSGKSTVLRALCGLAPKSAGNVQLTCTSSYQNDSKLSTRSFFDDANPFFGHGPV